MNSLENVIPEKLYIFVLVVVFSLLVGLEQGKVHGADKGKALFGTDRTFTFIGILGFVLYTLDSRQILFWGGGVALSVFLAIFYYQRISRSENYGLTSTILAIIVYCMAPLLITQPLWLVLLLLVVILILVETKEQLNSFAQKISGEEFITLSKFIIIAGIILPFLSNENIVPFLDISPKEVWLAVVVISGISYISYLLKQYVYPNSGIILSGILGGFYSSTATTIVLAKQSKSDPNNTLVYATAIFFSIAAMYVRLIMLVLIFNAQMSVILVPMFCVMVVVCVGVGWYFSKRQQFSEHKLEANVYNNPLQMKTAFIFAMLFIALSLVTHFSIENFGVQGINTLSWIVGFTDIDPFLLNLFQGKFEVDRMILVLAVLQAIASNNFLKMVYGKLFAQKEVGAVLIKGFSIITAASVIQVIFLLVL